MVYAFWLYIRTQSQFKHTGAIFSDWITINNMIDSFKDFIII